MSYPGSNNRVRYADSGNLDAFGRVRVSLPNQRFSALFDLGLRPLHYITSNIATGAVAWDATKHCASLSVATTGDEAKVQTAVPFPYRAGMSHLIFFTFHLAAPVAGLTQRAGYYDDADGFIFEVVDGVAQWTRRSSVSGSVVNTSFVQSAWNLDKLDGSGDPETNPSGLALNPEAPQIGLIDLQYLGVGRVRVAFDIDGEVIYVHEFLHANLNGFAPYMTSASLPVTYEIIATGNVSATMDVICPTVHREGNSNEPTVPRTFTTATAGASVGTAWTSVLGVRVKANAYHAVGALAQAMVLNRNASNPVEWRVVVNPPGLGGAVWIAHPENDSIFEMSRSVIAATVDGSGDLDVSATTRMRSAGIAGHAPAAAGSRGGSSVASASDYLPIGVAGGSGGTPDQIWVLARGLGGAAAPVHAIMTLDEIR